MIIKTSSVKENSYTLGVYIMKENASWAPYFVYRSDLRHALKNDTGFVDYRFTDFQDKTTINKGDIQQGKTQRGKKFISIGCKRFVGVNRTRLIRWAKSGK
jgi:hypothetical protein